MQKKTFFCLAVLLALSAAAPAYARSASEERILSFSSDIAVKDDGSMIVTETITVRAAHENIKHGIYRDFPTRYRDRLRNSCHVAFELVEVLRDGNPEDHHEEALSNGIRVYIGSRDAFVPPGVHVYAVTYRTSRQLGFFGEFDELYWNVTGNGWAFVIESARATVALPPALTGRIRSYEAYTGVSGARGRDYSAFIDESGRVVFVSTKPLAPYEGLTIAVTWPKGYIYTRACRWNKSALFYAG